MARSFTERGLWLPLGIGVAFALMVLWNLVFIGIALQTSPEVDVSYTEAIHR